MKTEECITDVIPVEIVTLCIVFTALFFAFLIYVVLSLFCGYIFEFYNDYDEFKKWKKLNKIKNDDDDEEEFIFN